MAFTVQQLLWQFRLLMWKNFLVQWRRGVQNFFLVLLPMVPPVAIALFRLLISVEDQCFRSCRDNGAQQIVSEMTYENSSLQIAYYPDTPLVRRIMETARCMSTGLDFVYTSPGNATGFRGEPFNTEAFNDSRLMEELVVSNGSRYYGAIVFEDLNDINARLKPQMNYTIRPQNKDSKARQANKFTWRTNRVYPVQEIPGIILYVDYSENFVPIQHIIDQAIMRLQVEGNTTCPLVSGCPDGRANESRTVCGITANVSSSLASATCYFNTTSQTTARCEANTTDFNCNCSRSFSRDNPSGLGLYEGNCTCNTLNIVSLTCNTTTLTNTACCGRCQTSDNNVSYIPTMFRVLPFPQYRTDILQILVGSLYSFIVLFCYLPNVIGFILELVIDKSTRLRESMRMMGLRTWLYWLTTFIKVYIILFPGTFIADIVLKATVLDFTDRGIVFLFYLIFHVQTVIFGFFISSLLGDPKAAAFQAGLLWYLTYTPFSFAARDIGALTRGDKWGLCLAPMSAASVFANLLQRQEQAGTGITMANMNLPTSIDDDFRFTDIISSMIASSILFGLLLWYKENVFPGEYGVAKVWYFPFSRAYWFGQPPRADDEQSLLSEVDPDKNEAEPTGLKVGVSIRKLRKVFRAINGNKIAVDDLSLNMYNDQITVLLGHNGAGKTTTMSLLVGLLEPTSGDAIIGGHSVVSDVDGARNSLGLCPQHNTLFSLLTVEEHLSFFYQLKKGHGGGAGDVREMIADLQLENKTKWLSTALSGGMKRKLSVGIALIGRPHVVILDEPTAGMDPYARRATWDLLGNYKKDCTMLLTTHLMDEADLLGDRIAIMSKGRLVCSGSSLFLKKKFGIGYHMVLVKDHDKECDEAVVTQKVLSIVPGSRLVGNAGSELAYVLPNNSSAHFSELFTLLETNQKELGLLSFGVSVTKLEEVFLKVGEDEGVVSNKQLLKYEAEKAKAEEEKKRLEGTDSKDTTTTQTSDGVNGKEKRVPKQLNMLSVAYTPLTGKALWLHQYKAMVKKRMISALRKIKFTVTSFIVPAVFVIFAFSVLTTSPSVQNDPPLAFNATSLAARAVFVADFRNTTERSALPVIHDSISTNYLRDGLGLDILDVADSSRMLEAGQKQCCSTTSFLFNETCIRRRYAQQESAFSSCPATFGFKHCPVCLNRTATYGRFAGSCDGCPAVPSLISRRRNSQQFQKRVLRDADVGPYLRLHPAAFTMHSVVTNPEDLPDNERSITYQKVSVDCNDPSMLSDNQTCQAYHPRVEQFTSNYDAERTNTYARVWFSAKSYHGLPIAVNTFSNMHLKSLMARDQKANARDYYIHTSNYPLPPPLEDEVNQVGSSISALLFSMFSTIGIALLTGSFVVQPVIEQDTKAKHIQTLCGVKSSAYWLANFTWDFIFYQLPAVVILIVFAAFDQAAYRGDGLFAVWVLLVLLGWSSIPMVYSISFAFKSSNNALKNTNFLMIMMAFVGIVANFVLNFPGIDEDKAAEVVRYIFFLVPHFCFAQGISDLYSLHEKKLICNRFPVVPTGRGLSRDQCYTLNNVVTDPFSLIQPGIGTECLYMFFMGFVFAAVTYLLEEGYLRILVTIIKDRLGKSIAFSVKSQATDGEDEDVARERENVTTNLAEAIKTQAVVMQNLTKVYNARLGRPAADNLCLTIPTGECFGLCGVNGAGKTTTFNMLTGDVPATSGKIYLQGKDISLHLREVQKVIGYCPQFDALLDQLTAREVLSVYCHLRGIPDEAITPTVENIIADMHLTDWANKPCGTYSGGNKRKLSVAVALVGNPPIIFLDEPTAGMDPGARRFLWDVMSDVLESGRSIVLTSHSMEECEALCTRMAIMVNGRFKCLGSIQHLKNKFGSGYSMSIKVGHSSRTSGDEDNHSQKSADKSSAAGNLKTIPSTAAVEKFVNDTFPGAELLESRQGQLHYNINVPGLTWSMLFREIESHREDLSIVDYSVTQATLEEVFVNFASAQFSESEEPVEAPETKPSAATPATENPVATPQPAAPKRVNTETAMVVGSPSDDEKSVAADAVEPV